MKKAILTFALLFAAGYLFGAMFNGFNTREWGTFSSFCFSIYTLFVLGISLTVYSTRS